MLFCSQLPDVEEEKKRPKSSKKGGKKKKKGEKEGKTEDKGKKEGKSEEGPPAPVVQAVGKHFLLQLTKEEDRAVACLLAEHELQVGLLQKEKENTTPLGVLYREAQRWT